ncbi:hypothetical protein [Pseudonocardia sp.]|uniref:hypothetical protein n=1 Tax=Pseudonocardia sp. TaxID=60912 RepID=UPI00262367E0|nr:hypothetical protein [Pseudonocardia sp.]
MTPQPDDEIDLAGLTPGEQALCIQLGRIRADVAVLGDKIVLTMVILAILMLLAAVALAVCIGIGWG